MDGMTMAEWLDDFLFTYETLIHALGVNGLLALSMYCVMAVGQLSLGQAAFMGIGAYTGALLTLNLGLPFWLVLLFCPAGLVWQTIAFFAFRFFDIFKPQPARYFDQMKNGFGVMTDDLIAGGYTLLALAALRFFVPFIVP